MTKERKKTPSSGERKQEVRSVRERLKDYGMVFASIASGINPSKLKVNFKDEGPRFRKKE